MYNVLHVTHFDPLQLRVESEQTCVCHVKHKVGILQSIPSISQCQTCTCTCIHHTIHIAIHMKEILKVSTHIDWV